MAIDDDALSNILRIFLACLICIFVLCGVPVLIIGAVALGNTPLSQNLELFMSISPFMAGSILLVIGGSMMIIVGIWGCISALASNSKCLLMFLILLVITILMVVIAGILGYAFIANFNDNFKSYFQTNILYFYGTNNEVWSVDTQVDNIQKSFSCCGVTGNSTSSTQSWYIWRSQSAWYQIKTAAQGGGPPYVPQSCCVTQSDGSPSNAGSCQGSTGTATATAPPIAVPGNSTTTNGALNTVGCYDAISNYILSWAYLVGAFGVIFGGCSIPLVILTLIFLRQVELQESRIM